MQKNKIKVRTPSDIVIALQFHTHEKIICNAAATDMGFPLCYSGRGSPGRLVPSPQVQTGLTEGGFQMRIRDGQTWGLIRRKQVMEACVFRKMRFCV